ncbi:PRC-barrel domain-containing protein [Streptomyces sp. NPDC018693]|uniref:PRC-barrel domain-containing protein n=1 Tax=unclassified Streptomyces TaxID=2593676 RepID=UPI0037B7C510
MKATDLLGIAAVDDSGRRLGAVHDIRLSRPSPGAPWRIDAVVVGRSALTYRFGYAEHDVTGPYPLALVARWLRRRTQRIPWTQVLSVEPDRLVVRPERKRAAS